MSETDSETGAWGIDRWTLLGALYLASTGTCGVEQEKRGQGREGTIIDRSNYLALNLETLLRKVFVEAGKNTFLETDCAPVASICHYARIPHW